MNSTSILISRCCKFAGFISVLLLTLISLQTPAFAAQTITGTTINATTLNATTIAGTYTGTLSAANISAAIFGSNTGGGTYVFPGGVQSNGYNNVGYFAMNNASTYWGIMGNYGINDWRIGYGSATGLTGWNLRWDASGNVWIAGTLSGNGSGLTGVVASSLSNMNISQFTNNSGYLASGASPTFGSLYFTGVGGDSGQAACSYCIQQESGGWVNPYPDLRIGYHTGIKIGAYYGYNGIRFYNNSDMVTQTMSIGDGDNNVRVANTLYVGGNVYSNGTSAYGLYYNSGSFDTVGTGSSGDPLELNYYLPGDVRIVGGDVTMADNRYLYPGSITVGYAYQKNWYLASSPSWGLYTNTSFYAAGGLYTAGGYGILGPNTTYGTINLWNAKNGYYGVLFGPGGTSYPNIMFDGSGNGGIYYENWGWTQYFTVATRRTSINYGGDLGYTLGINGSVGADSFYYRSDASQKKNVITLTDSLDKVMKLRGVSFSWKDDGKPSIGVIAQEVEKVYPELVNTSASTGLKSVEYGNLVAPLIEAVKEQQKQINSQKKAIEILQSEIKALKK